MLLSLLYMMAAKFVILRHGRSTWNKLNKFTGWNDVPLCDIGIKEDFEGDENYKDQFHYISVQDCDTNLPSIITD